MIIIGIFEKFVCRAYQVILLMALVSACFPLLVHAIDISDTPLDIQLNAAPSNVMFILDNSASMDSEFMTAQDRGLPVGGSFYLFADNAYTPRHDHFHGPGHALAAESRFDWRSQWCGANRIYYDQRLSYHPWPSTRAHTFVPSDINRPLSHPVVFGDQAPRLILSARFGQVASGSSVITIRNAHYYVLDDINGNGIDDAHEPVYLVTWQDSNEDGVLDVTDNCNQDRRLYYRLIDDGDGRVEDNELLPVTSESELSRIRPAIFNERGVFIRYKTDAEDLQNFANWVTFYRRRQLAATAAVANAIYEMKNVYIGLYALHHLPRIAVQPVGLSADLNNDSSGSDQAEFLLDALYQMKLSESTPLRSALDQVGRYYHQGAGHELGRSPFQEEENGGACQSAYSVIVSDGFWNGSFSGLGNVDGMHESPYRDPWSNTLADIAMYYHETDLAPLLPDLLPPLGCDDARHQHMTTCCISLGANGMIDILDIDGDGQIDKPGYLQDPCFKNLHTPHPQWPAPYPDTTAGIDDLWHAAVNGRGRFLVSTQSQSLNSIFGTRISNNGIPVNSSFVADDMSGFTHRSIVYQARFHAEDWRGELLALSFNPLSSYNHSENAEIIWNAADRLDRSGVTWDTRRIVTYGGPMREPRGIPFRFRDLSDSQKSALGSDLIVGSAADATARDILDFIRGREFVHYRQRLSKLGDIVNSTPALHGRSIYVGANDGMLHVFNADNGDERFGYIPNLVFDQLVELSRTDYSDRHRFYVDETVSIGEVEVDLYSRRTYLVGGLGKGGKGYYCLLIGSRQRPQNGAFFGEYQQTFSVDEIDADGSEHVFANIVQWEYPRPDPSDDNMDNNGDGFTDENGESDPDIGFSFSQAYAVNANAPENDYRPVVIFGNGYNSVNGKAVLLVLEAASGRVLRKIDTGAGDDNGLSTPALIDVDLDRRVDYAYAGDLKGNLWKFDLTSEDPSEWGIAYGSDNNSNGSIDAADGDKPEPLFQATGQPITGRPDVMRMRSACSAQAPGYMVVFGTGKYLGSSDRADLRQQTIYGLWDFGDDGDDSEHLGFMTDRSTGLLSSGLYLVPQHIMAQFTEKDRTFREISAANVDYRMLEDTRDGDGTGVNNKTNQQNPNPESVAGWFLDFPVAPDPLAVPGERITGRTIIRGGNVVIVSFAPILKPCGSGGTSRIYVLKACNGQTPLNDANEPQLPWSHPFKIHEEMCIAASTENKMLNQILAGDLNGAILMEGFPGEQTGRIYWRQNLQQIQ